MMSFQSVIGKLKLAVTSNAINPRRIARQFQLHAFCRARETRLGMKFACDVLLG
jgi:hypothetical protein